LRTSLAPRPPCAVERVARGTGARRRRGDRPRARSAEARGGAGRNDARARRAGFHPPSSTARPPSPRHLPWPASGGGPLPRLGGAGERRPPLARGRGRARRGRATAARALGAAVPRAAHPLHLEGALHPLGRTLRAFGVALSLLLASSAASSRQAGRAAL